MFKELCRCSGSHGYNRTTEKTPKAAQVSKLFSKVFSPTQMTSDDEKIHDTFS